MTKKDFIKEVTDGLLPPPQYFSKNAALNKKGYGSFDAAMQQGQKALSVEEFKALQNDEDVLLLDVRGRWDFVNAFIPNSLFIGLGGSFAPWVGALVPDLNQKIALIVEPGKEEEAVRRLTRVGYDNAIGYLDGGIEAWKNAGEDVEQIETLKVDEFISQLPSSSKKVIDVRKPTEYETAGLVCANNIALDDFLETNFESEIDKEAEYFLHCRSGFRSTIAISYLRRKNFSRLTNVIGAFDDIKTSGLEVSGSCPSLQPV